MEDLNKAWNEIFKPTDPPNEADLKNTTETPRPISFESPLLPPEGQAWLNGLNRFCRRAVEHDLRACGPDLFVKYWMSLRDTLQKLERTSVLPITGSACQSVADVSHLAAKSI